LSSKKNKKIKENEFAPLWLDEAIFQSQARHRQDGRGAAVCGWSPSVPSGGRYA